MTVINSKISIIVPVYNAEHVIKRCVDSLLKQSYPGIEIIIVNDGSTDQTDMICRQYADSDNRIVYIRQKNMYSLWTAMILSNQILLTGCMKS